MSISGNLSKLNDELPEGVTVIAVSKRKPIEDILEAFEAGHRTFGENRVQELIEKQPKLPDEIEWHMVGHLQTNKVKYLAPFVTCIHSVDSVKLLNTISRESEKSGRKISCLLQVHIAQEENKFGFSAGEIIQLAEEGHFSELSGVFISGVMGMATYTDDREQVRGEFRTLKKIFDELKAGVFAENRDFSEISMGMSGDYKMAVEEGSTMIRVGTVIFGPRTY